LFQQHPNRKSHLSLHLSFFRSVSHPSGRLTAQTFFTVRMFPPSSGFEVYTAGRLEPFWQSSQLRVTFSVLSLLPVSLDRQLFLWFDVYKNLCYLRQCLQNLVLHLV
jgi:hypothetical protein